MNLNQVNFLQFWCIRSVQTTLPIAKIRPRNLFSDFERMESGAEFIQQKRRFFAGASCYTTFYKVPGIFYNM